MKQETVYVILASQDFEKANHHNLWLSIAEKSNCQVYVANIMADYCTSIIKKRFERLYEAKSSPTKVTDKLTVFRPLVIARPEVIPECLWGTVRKGFWKSLLKVDSGIKCKTVNVIVYNEYWVKILKGSHPDMKIAYYLFDEVRYNGNDCSINKRRYALDEYACKNSDIIYTMTRVLAKSREIYNGNIIVMGNGAINPKDSDIPSITYPRSVAFIGNFRNWINEGLLERIIEKMPDVHFVFAGHVEDNMMAFMNKLLNTYNNTSYFGVVSKKRMTQLYRMFNVVIIPYKLNPFIQATRPIKIVESVLSGTPIVTVPMDGYEESDFIKFANTEDDFCHWIDWLLANPINKSSESYIKFCEDNTWSRIAERIIESFA